MMEILRWVGIILLIILFAMWFGYALEQKPARGDYDK